MATIDNQVILSYAPGDIPGTGEFQEEVQNQQLNDALGAGTVDTILMKQGYSAIHDRNVVVKSDLVDYAKLDDLDSTVSNITTYDFGDTGDTNNVMKLYIKSNPAPISYSPPNGNDITRRGELAVDNYDGSIYLLGSGGTAVQKVDAGTVNGFIIEQDVLSGTGESALMTRAQIKALINSVFSYDGGSNSLTINAL